MSNPDITKNLGLDHSSQRDKWRKGLIAGGIAALLIIAAVVWLSRGDTRTVQYKTEKAQRGDLTVTVTATGNLEPTNQVDVGSELSGIVKSVDADYNDRVKVGQVLAKLDTSKLDAQVLQMKASLQAAQAKVADAQATVLENKLKYQRCKTLAQQQMCSSQDLDTAHAAYVRAQAQEESAKAMVSQARATLDAIETDLSKAVIRSPINGIVLKRTVEPGQTVAASLQAPVLFTLAEDLTKMELHVDVDEADVGKVKAGQEATFTVDAYPDRSFPAKISQVRYGSQTVQGVVTYETILNVDNSDLALRPGMTATADIVVKQVHDALLVANAALRFTPPTPPKKAASRGGGVFSRLFPRPSRSTLKQRDGPIANAKEERVWVLKDNALTPVTVSTGSTNGVMTEITAGKLEAGSAVVTDVLNTKS